MSSVFTLANLLTILRLLLVPVFVMAVYYQYFGWALALFVIAAITDGLDGLVARAFNQKTELGAILDPMADKLLLVTAFIILSLHGFTITSPIPFWVTVAAISRDVFIVLGALVIPVLVIAVPQDPPPIVYLPLAIYGIGWMLVGYESRRPAPDHGIAEQTS